MKRNYNSPILEIVKVQTDAVCEVITQSDPSDDFAKPNNDEVEQDDEIAAPIKDVWTDEEKKIDK